MPLVSGQTASAHASATTVAASFPGACAAGNLLIAGAHGHSIRTNITDNIDTALEAVTRKHTTANIFADIWYVENCSSGSHTLTRTSASDDQTICIAEYDSIPGTGALDKTAFSDGFGTSATSTNTANTAQANELLIGLTACESAGGNMTATGSMTEDVENDTTNEAMVASRTVTAIGAYANSATLASANWVCNIATFKSTPPSVAQTGTVTASITEADIVTGGKTSILTVTDDTLVPDEGTPTFVAGTTKATTGAPGRAANGTLSVAYPSGYTPTAGHFALIILYNDAGSGSVPTNWTQITGSPWGGGTPKLQAFYKVLVGGDATPVTTISGSSGTLSHCANMVIYSGVGSVGAIGAASNGTGTPMTAAQITTTANNALVLGLCGRGDNENASAQTFGGSATGVTERLDGGTSSGDDSQVSMYDKALPTSGTASGNGSATTSATDPWVSVLIELKPSTPFADARAAIRDFQDSAQAEGTGYDAVVKPNIPLGNIVRTSDTVCTITLQAQGSYNITAQEVITGGLPGEALVGGLDIVATPTFTIDTSGGAARPPSPLTMLGIGD